jgi:hypothetical protein
MLQTFGQFDGALPPSQEYLILNFSPSSVPIQQRWRNNGLSADFLADYLTTFFPGDEESSTVTGKQAEIKGAVSFIANELLENAMKFNDETSQHSISIALHLYCDRLVLLVTNSIPAQTVSSFQALLTELTTADPSELYLRHLEGEDSSSSGLGFLTIINDYAATLGWRFEILPKSPPVTTVTTMVQLSV